MGAGDGLAKKLRRQGLSLRQISVRLPRRRTSEGRRALASAHSFNASSESRGASAVAVRLGRECCPSRWVPPTPTRRGGPTRSPGLHTRRHPPPNAQGPCTGGHEHRLEEHRWISRGEDERSDYETAFVRI